MDVLKTFGQFMNLSMSMENIEVMMEEKKTVEMLFDDLKKSHEDEIDEETMEIIIAEMILAMLF